MKLSCTVCYELFSTSDDVHAAPCGHLLHFKCWSGWLRRTQSCPECRTSTLPSQLIKLFFSIEDGEDFSTLKNKYESLQIDLQCKIAECQSAEVQLETQRAENVELRSAIQEIKLDYEAFKKVVQSNAKAGKKKNGTTNVADIADAVQIKRQAEKFKKDAERFKQEAEKLKKEVETLGKEAEKLRLEVNKTNYEDEYKRILSIIGVLNEHKNDFDELKRYKSLVKKLKAYTDLYDGETDYFDDVDDEPDKYVDLFKEVRKFWDFKEKRDYELARCPRGCVLHLSGFPAGQGIVSWSHIRDTIEDLGGDVAFTTYNLGDTEAYVRLQEGHEPARRFVRRIHNGNLYISNFLIKARALAGNEETRFLKRSLDARDKRFNERSRRRVSYLDEDSDDDPETDFEIYLNTLITLQKYAHSKLAVSKATSVTTTSSTPSAVTTPSSSGSANASSSTASSTASSIASNVASNASNIAAAMDDLFQRLAEINRPGQM